jgi:ArsR family transcriptional regulator
MPTQDQAFGRLLHAIADPTRRRILQVLKIRGACSIGKDTGLCACDIEGRIHLSQPTISHHMRILQKAGLVEAKKEGHWRWYQRNERTIKQFAKMLRQAL